LSTGLAVGGGEVGDPGLADAVGGSGEEPVEGQQQKHPPRDAHKSES